MSTGLRRKWGLVVFEVGRETDSRGQFWTAEFYARIYGRADACRDDDHSNFRTSATGSIGGTRGVQRLNIAVARGG
jgi:hypothetical protein